MSLQPPTNTPARDTPATGLDHVPSAAAPLDFLVFMREEGYLASALARVLDPLIASGRIAGWRHRSEIPVESLATYAERDSPWPVADAAGWIDEVGLVHLVPATAGEAGPQHQKRVQESLRLSRAMARYPEWLRAVFAQIQPPPAPADPAAVCYCGHPAADHHFRDCTRPDRTGLLCPCTRFHHQRPIPAPATLQGALG